MDPLWINTPQHLHQGGLTGGSNGLIVCLDVLSFLIFLFLFLSALLSFLFHPSLSPSPFLTRSFSLLFRVEGTSEGSGWLSLLEADGRPKARRPKFHEAWFEHARTMSRGMPMDDGCMECVCD